MLRFGLIGAGGIGAVHGRWAARHRGAEFCAVADPSAVARQNFADQYGASAYASHADMLAAEKLDVVSIAAPHNQLAPIARDCLNAGCHVLLEKPMALHIAQGQALIDLAEARGLKLGVCYQYRSFETPKLIKQIIDSGEIGDIRQIIWTWNELRSDAYFTGKSWRQSWAGAGSGLVMNQLIHDLDLLRWFAGDEAEVQAMATTQSHDIAMEDAISANIRFEGGALCSISGSINHSHAGNYRAILGDKGLIVIPDAKPLAHNPNDRVKVGIYQHPVADAVARYTDDHQQSAIKWRALNSHGGGRFRAIASSIKGHLRPVVKPMLSVRPTQAKAPVNGHGKLLWQFFDAIADDTALPDGLSADNALATLECANALIQSAAKRGSVKLPLDPAAYAELFDSLCDGSASLQKDADGQA